MPKIVSGLATNICKRKAKKYSFEGSRVIDYQRLPYKHGTNYLTLNIHIRVHAKTKEKMEALL